MRPNDPNRAQLVKVARAIGDLSSDVVFLGGATVGLLITDSAAPRVRPTKDVDVVVEVASYAEYQVKIGSALRDAGFVECADRGAPICAWNSERRSAQANRRNGQPPARRRLVPRIRERSTKLIRRDLKDGWHALVAPRLRF